MRNLVIAKRYAKALFSLSQEDGEIERYGKELVDFAQLVKEIPELANAIQNPLYPEATRKTMFQSVAEKAGLSPVVRSFINLLIEKKRVQYMQEIADYYHKLVDEHSNIAHAQLRSATELDEDVLQDIAHARKDDRQKNCDRVSARPQLDRGGACSDWRFGSGWECEATVTHF